jgi:hypothetical protein
MERSVSFRLRVLSLFVFSCLICRAGRRNCREKTKGTKTNKKRKPKKTKRATGPAGHPAADASANCLAIIFSYTPIRNRYFS